MSSGGKPLLVYQRYERATTKFLLNEARYCWPSLSNAICKITAASWYFITHCSLKFFFACLHADGVTTFLYPLNPLSCPLPEFHTWWVQHMMVREENQLRRDLALRKPPWPPRSNSLHPWMSIISCAPFSTCWRLTPQCVQNRPL